MNPTLVRSGLPDNRPPPEPKGVGPARSLAAEPSGDAADAYSDFTGPEAPRGARREARRAAEARNAAPFFAAVELFPTASFFAALARFAAIGFFAPLGFFAAPAFLREDWASALAATVRRDRLVARFGSARPAALATRGLVVALRPVCDSAERVNADETAVQRYL